MNDQFYHINQLSTLELPEDLFLSNTTEQRREEGSPVHRFENEYQGYKFSSSISCESEVFEDMSGCYSLTNSEPRRSNRFELYDINIMDNLFEQSANQQEQVLPRFNVIQLLHQSQQNNLQIGSTNQILEIKKAECSQESDTDSEMVFEEQKNDSSSSFNSQNEDMESANSNTANLEKAKRTRTKLKSNNFQLKSKRRDVVFKTILRQMRKCLTKEFNRVTNYQKVKSQFGPEFLFDKLGEFLDKIKVFGKPTKQVVTEDASKLRKDSIMFLGAFLYPKQTKDLIKETQKQKIIDLIHSSLYSFSICKLDFLNQFPVYAHLLNHFIKNYKDSSMKQNQSMACDKFDYNEGFKYLQKYYKVQEL